MTQKYLALTTIYCKANSCTALTIGDNYSCEKMMLRPTKRLEIGSITFSATEKVLGNKHRSCAPVAEVRKKYERYYL